MSKTWCVRWILLSVLSWSSSKCWNLLSKSFRASVSLSSLRLPLFPMCWVSFTCFVLSPCTCLSFHQQNKRETKHLNYADLCPITSFLLFDLLFVDKLLLSCFVSEWWSFEISMRETILVFAYYELCDWVQSHHSSLSPDLQSHPCSRVFHYFKHIIIRYV